MPNRFHLIALLFVVISLMLAVSARAQNAAEERERLQEQQLLEGKNPLLPKRTQVAFSGTGSVRFSPRSLSASMPEATPDPNCTPTVTQVGFNVQCLSDPDVKSTSTCRGSMSFYGFNETRSVVGEVTARPGDVYSMKLKSSSDDDIQGCELANIGPVSNSLGNEISMPGCAINIAGCAGEAIGAGADRALTSSGSVILTPTD
jgi:hypothetical protein